MNTKVNEQAGRYRSEAPTAHPSLRITGFQSPADDYLSAPLSLDELTGWGAPQRWLWRVDTDDLRTLGVQRDDLLVVDRSADIRPGVLVVVAVDSEHVLTLARQNSATAKLELVRRYEDGRPVLLIRDDETCVWGVGQFLLRRLEASAFRPD